MRFIGCVKYEDMFHVPHDRDAHVEEIPVTDKGGRFMVHDRAVQRLRDSLPQETRRS